jgi:hypothetical protein
MACLRIFLPLALSFALMNGSWAAQLPFRSSEIEGPGSEIFFCDMDGDGLQDAVLVDGLNLSIFFADSRQGFNRRFNQQLRLDGPAVVWSARLGRNAESLLLMTSESVTELQFTNRSGAPTRRPIIKQQTIIPEKLDEAEVLYFPLSAETTDPFPLLLIPVTGGLQVWQNREGWRQVQFIGSAVDTRIRPSVTNAGYAWLFGLSISVADVNRDQRDDLMVMRDVAGSMQTYALYLQQSDGLFGSEPAQTYTNRNNRRIANCWVDINRDGKLDVIKSTVADEPSFIPGLPSGKIVVGLHLADEYGRVPAEPQQFFRKNDWSAALPAVDVDGDGFVDLVLGHIPINTREGFRKMVTSKQIDLDLKFHFNRPGSGIPNAPSFQRDLLIRYDQDFSFAPERRLYYERFVNLNGDFNGDGRKDLLVRDRSNEISAYFFASRQKGFSPKADLRFSCPEAMDWWDVKDLNADGMSDLIIKLQERDVFRMFTSQGK